ncbi:formate dehydrogenase subunit gamma [Allopusillimonas ginsengisoli]|uniref:formate dehydrogenase subunit gamma n=1 Tax=Allopusillimonas ginsengisoli TaxID=453575 RepID=UPI0010C22D91|nr:formate dehydrogenase subunit gamma [Allopusillimonas ginsengisoli]
MTDDKQGRLIVRYTTSQRINHWIIAITFVLLALSGLALFHPALYWMSNLFGGGPWTRILHPYVGVVLFVCFYIFAARMFRHNLMDKHDAYWLRNFGDVLNARDEKFPHVGRYNAGQKVLFFALLFLVLGLLLTGLVMWREYFSAFFPIWALRLASVLHAVFALLMICAIIVHIYAGIWVKGSVKAMTRGTVTPGWAWKHHRAWFRQVRKNPQHK